MEKYFRAIERADIQNKFQMDIYVGDADGAPPPNEAHFIVKEDGFWKITDWSRGQRQSLSSFLTLSDALNFSFCRLTRVVSFHRVARSAGHNPLRYGFTETVEALSIAFHTLEVSFSVEKDAREMVAARGGKTLKLSYSTESEYLNAAIYRRDCWNSRHDNLFDASRYLYWNFSLPTFETQVF